MKKQAAGLLPSLLLLLLAGCTSVPPLSPGEVKWQDHVARLSQVSHWRLDGKLGFRSPREGGSASLKWAQDGSRYQLNLSGPFGAGAARIEGDGESAMLISGDEVYSDHPALMALQLVGAPIPVDALGWWVRGIPSPDEEPEQGFVANDVGLAQHFSQAGWQVDLDRYRDSEAGPVPGRVSGRFGEYSFKLVIASWQFPVEGQP